MRSIALSSLVLGCVFGLTFRPPAVPLAVSSPFFSIWSFDAGQLATQTTFWHGDAATLDSLIRVDGVTYTLMGAGSFPPAVQHGYPLVDALTSTYNFSVSSQVGVTLRFTTPQLPGNWEALSRQATYIEWDVVSLDGSAHTVEILFDSSAEVVVGGFPGEEVEWDRPAVPGLPTPTTTVLRMGLVGQKVEGGFNLTAHMLLSKEPHQQQDYGFVFVIDGSEGGSSGATSSSQVASQSTVHKAFSTTGSLPGASGDATPPSPASSSGSGVVVAALAWSVSLPANPAPTPVTLRAILLCDEVAGILNYQDFLPGLWRKSYPAGDTSILPSDGLVGAVTQGDALLSASAAFNAGQRVALTAAGGESYAAVTLLTYRQVLGANAVVWNGSSTWVYQKEISSDGDLSTLDVIFPAAPQLLYHTNGSILRATIEPHLYLMAGMNPNNHFSQPCALHSLGKWPVVDAGNGGCSMPMESTGDILLMAAGVTMAQGGDGAWVAPYMPLLTKFADYCDASLPFPAPQDMTDDFSHAPGNLTNLALKCILGMAAQSYQALSQGNTSEASRLAGRAKTQAEFFIANGWSSSVPTPHFRFIYNDTWADSSGLMYNALWARILGAEGLFPDFYPKFEAHFSYLATLTANATWCLPLSSMEHDSKWDWLMHTAALMYTGGGGGGGGAPPSPSNYTNKIFDQLFTFANTTTSRFPLTDHPECTGPAPAAAADRARPVLGAFYAPLLIASPPVLLAQEQSKFAKYLSTL